MRGTLIQLWEQVKAVEEEARESLVEFNWIAVRGIDRTIQQQLALARDCAAITVNHLKVLNEAKRVQDVLRAEVRLATEFGEIVRGNAQKAFEISLQIQNELGQWVSEQLEGVQARAQKTLPKAA